MRWGVRLLGVASTVILARLLEPSDFGVVAMAMLVVGFVDMWVAFGLDVALIQNQAATREHYDTVWTLMILQSAFIATTIAVLAPLAATYFGEPRVSAVLWVVAGAILAGGFGNVGVVEFRKRFEFHKEFVVAIVGKVIGFVVTITSAFALRSYWALVLGIVAGYVSGVVVGYLLHPFRPRLSLARVSELWGFSQWMLVNSFAVYADQKAPELIVGRQFGADALGLYTVAGDVAQLPTTELAQPVNRALFPAFAKLNQDPERANSGLVQAVQAIVMVTLPAGVGLALVAEPLTVVMLGEKWADAAPVLVLLALAGSVRIVSSASGSFMIALGRVKDWGRVLWLQAVGFVLAGVGAGWWLGLEGVAAARLAVALAVFPLPILLLRRMTGLRVREVAAALVRPALASAVMALAVYGVSLVGESSALVLLLSQVVVGMVVYAATIFMLWHGAGRPTGAEEFVMGSIRPYVQGMWRLRGERVGR